jgi:hypothetical protein
MAIAKEKLIRCDGRCMTLILRLEDRKREQVPQQRRSRSTFYRGTEYWVFSVETVGEECICVLVVRVGCLHTGKVF